MRLRHVVIVAVLLASLAVVLLAMGRLPICACGTVRLWVGTRFSNENSQQLFDWWSLSHVVHGFLLYGGLWIIARKAKPTTLLIAAICIEGAWEIFENTNFIIERYRNAGAVDYFGDSVINSVGDVLSMMLGFVLAMRLPIRASAATVAGLELMALVAIRDNLTLNIIMLIRPIETIRVWQEGG